MSTVRVNDDIKKEIMPILNALGMSLSEAINMFLCQIKLNNGLPFEVRIKEDIELNDGNGSYICKHGCLHDYSEIDFEEIEKDTDGKVYNNVNELKEELEGE